MHKLRLLSTFYKQLAHFNIPFSLFIGLLVMGADGFSLQSFLSGFFFTLITGGYLLSVYFYEMRAKDEYYFYYNQGISRWALHAFCISTNLFIYYSFSFIIQAQ